MSVDDMISEIYNSRIWKVILIGDNATLLDYEHQFMKGLHVVDSKSQNSASSRCYLHRVIEYSWLL